MTRRGDAIAQGRRSAIVLLVVTIGCGEPGFAPTGSVDAGEVESPAPAASPAAQRRRFAEPDAGRTTDLREKRPNILVVALDNVRADRVSSYGHVRATTPNLDALAARGTRFAHAISQAPYTPHSFASMMTSLYVSDLPVRVRDRQPADLVRAGLEDYHFTLAEALRQTGYDTAAIVMGWFTEAFGLTQGFDSVNYSQRKTMSEVVDASLRWLDDWSDRGRERPFFLFAYSVDVHAEFMRDRPPEQHVFGGDPDGFRYSRDQMRSVTRGDLTPSADDFENARTVYDEGLYWADREVAPLLERLAELGIYDDTIVVFVSDHGEEFGEHGFIGHSQSNFQQVIHVPLIIADPRIGDPRVIEHRVMNVDVMPTILDLASVPIPAMAKGLSLAPSMRGQEQPELAARVLYSDGAPNGFVGATIVGRYKLLVRRPQAGRYLYDLDADPQETNNLVEAMPDLAQRLEEVLFAHKRDGLATQLLLGMNLPIMLGEMALPTVVDGLDLDPSNGSAVSGLSEETRRQLEALGYLQPDEQRR